MQRRKLLGTALTIGGLALATWRAVRATRHLHKALTVGLIDPSAGDFYWTNFWFELAWTVFALIFVWIGIVLIRKARVAGPPR